MCRKYKEIIRRKHIEMEYYRSKYETAVLALQVSSETNSENETSFDSESIDYEHINLFARLISQKILQELNKHDLVGRN